MILTKFQTIKQALLDKMDSGEWSEGMMLPPEVKIAKQFSVSRMTARRAIIELVTEYKLLRQAGVGTFVAPAKPQMSLLEIRNIADEIKERGHIYSSQVLKLERAIADVRIAQGLDVAIGGRVYVSEILHLENNIPLQLESRFINPSFAPDYINQHFSENNTPAGFLNDHYPLSRASYFIEARICTDHERNLLDLSSGDAVLHIRRQTWSDKGLISLADLVHPGSRFTIGGYLNIGSRVVS